MIDASDERSHAPGPEPLWGESWYFDFAAADGSLGGYVRLGLYPNQGVAWWWAYVVGDGRRPVLVRDHEVELPAQGLEIRAEALWGELTCETPHEHWSIGMEAFGVALDDPADAYRGERGDRIGVGLDLEWEADAPVYEYELTTRYEQACTVHGEVLLGDETIAFEGPGERDHSWGVRDWWSFPWTWTAGRLDDGTAFHAAGTQIDGNPVWHAGFVVDGDGLRPADRFLVDTELGDERIPTAARMDFGALQLSARVRHPAALLLVAPDARQGRFPRALCEFSDDSGRRGVGWTEWNQPPPPA